MALPVLASTQDVLDQVPDLGITASTTPSEDDVTEWLTETNGEIISRLRGAGVDITTDTSTPPKLFANSEELDEAATEWLNAIAVRGASARVFRVRRLYEQADDVRRQFYGDISRIERDPATLGISATTAGPAALKRSTDPDRTRVTLNDGSIW